MGTIDSIQIDKKNDVPIWVQLKQRITFLIVSGVFQPGEMLPTVRELAAQLDANYHTVNKVYRDLEANGLVEIKVGCGTRVSESLSAFNLIQNETTLIVKDFIESMFARGMNSEDILYTVARNLNVHVSLGEARERRPAGGLAFTGSSAGAEQGAHAQGSDDEVISYAG